jgi:exodeoxyribonuclease-5
MPATLDLSADQDRALSRLLAWIGKSDKPWITLGGYAGTGKTTLMAILRQEIRRANPVTRVAFCAYTGKASQVLRTELDARGALYDGDTCSTIHALLYTPEVDAEGRILTWKRAKEINAELIIVDEASMVTSDIWADLRGTDLPIIALGDHGQLPPIGGDFNLMQEADITLEKIHRQAEGNPIIALAHRARLEGKIDVGDYSSTVRKFTYATHDAAEIGELTNHLFSRIHDDTLILCGRNKTRVDLNRGIRQLLDRESPEPEYGDKVVCLKNIYENFYQPIYNGMTGTIHSIEPHKEHWYNASIEFPDEGRTYYGALCKAQFNSPTIVENVKGINFKDIGARFDFGYALTVHKAQGSQARTVVLFEERFIKSDDEQWRRWLYTAITRARENLYIIASH